MLAALALLLLQAPNTPPGLEARSVSVLLTDSSGRGVTDLAGDELALVENGVVRDVVKIAKDERPLTVAILVDTSQELSSIYRLYLIDAVTSLVNALPAGARYSIWVTDDKGAVTALKKIAPTGGNTMLDAIVESSRELQKLEGERAVVLVVTGNTTEFSSRDRFHVVEEAQKNADLFLFFSFDEGDASFDNRLSYDYVMQQLTKSPGGRLERAVTAMAASKALVSLARELQPTLRLTYETPPDLKSRKVEVQVSRPGLQVRVGASR
jgi:hypothetical protein